MIVGLDIGYSSVKIAYGTGRVPEVIRMPVGAGPLKNCGVDFAGNRSIGRGHPVLIKDQEWVAGIDPSRLAYFVPTMDSSYPTTDQYRALFYAALSEVGESSIDMLVTGLPVSHFREGGVRAELTRMMKGNHHIRPDFKVEVKNVLVTPQPAGAFGAFSLDAALGRVQHQIESTSAVLVVDPGHYSLDWVIFLGDFKMESSGTTTTAGEEVVKRAAEHLSVQHGKKVRYAKLQDAVLSGAKPLMVGGTPIEFWPALTAVAGDIIDTNLTALRNSIRTLNDDRGVDYVLVAGGGAEMFKGPLTDAFPESEVIAMKDPVVANARGFYFYGVRANKSA